MNIIKRHGIAADSEQLKRGMLGVSIGNHYFSKEKVSAIASLGTAVCKEFIVVLVDRPERWNWPLKQERSMTEHEACVEQLSLEKRKGFNRALLGAGLRDSVPLLDWQTAVGGSANYQRNVNIVENAYAADGAFCSGVQAQVRHNVGGKIADHETRLGRSLTTTEYDALSHYMLEEVAGLCSLWFDEGYIDFYNQPTMPVIQGILHGKYPAVSEAMAYDYSQYGLVELG